MTKYIRKPTYEFYAAMKVKKLSDRIMYYITSADGERKPNVEVF